MARRRLSLWVGLCCCLWAAFAWAEEMTLLTGHGLPSEPWRLRAEKIIYEGARHTYIGEGRVELRQGDRRLTADRIEVNSLTKIALMQGNVMFILGEDIFSGKEGHFNLATRCGELSQARLFVRKNHFHVRGEVLRKTGEQSYYAEKATVTTCDADRPAWSFTARSLTVVLEGYATGHHNVLRLAGIPVLYVPYGVVPIRTVRQSGLIMPFVGQHRAGGTVVEVPFFWAISNHADATFYQNVITNRGYMQGAEFRYRGHGEAAGHLRFVYINDGHAGAPTPNRYWAAGMITQPLSDSVTFRGTLDRLSDPNYLQDFNYGYLGLNRYTRELLAEMGRDLDPQEVPVRVSTALVSTTPYWGNFTVFSRYYQKLRDDDPSPYHRLPGLSLTTMRLPLGSWPLALGLEAFYGHFLQNQRHGQQGQKLDLHPSLFSQVQVFPGLSLDGRLGYRQTLFLLDRSLPEGPKDTPSRQLFDAKISLSSHWFKDYGPQDGTRYRHLFRPEVTYWNMPRYPARRYPAFDPFDWGWVDETSRNLPVRDGDNPLGAVNALTYGFSTNLLRRSLNSQGQALVTDLFWFRLTQSVFFNSRSMAFDGSHIPHHRFSDFLGEMELYPLNRLHFGLDLGLSPYHEGFNRSNVKFKFYDDKRQNYLSLGYLYIRDYASQINVETYVDVLRSLKTWLSFSHTFLTQKKLERRYGVIFQRQCWGISLSYTERPDDQRVGVTIIIPGLTEKWFRSPGRAQAESQLRP